MELAVFESRKKKEESSSFDPFQEEDRVERDILCSTLVSVEV